jgi:hypothetical protein
VEQNSQVLHFILLVHLRDFCMNIGAVPLLGCADSILYPCRKWVLPLTDLVPVPVFLASDVLTDLLSIGTILGIAGLAGVGLALLKKHWYRATQLLFFVAMLLADAKVLRWALTSDFGFKTRVGLGLLGLVGFTAAGAWAIWKVQTDMREESAADEIRPFYDLLTPAEKTVLRFILPLGRSPTNLNVGQINALESIQQKTGFVGRNYTTGSYELNLKTIEGLKILLPADAGLYGKIVCREISLVPQDQFYTCFLILSVKLMTDGGPTKAGRWQLDLFWEGADYPSVRQSVDGYYVSYPSSHADDPTIRLEPKSLIDFSSDEEITNISPRTGWLRFKVGAFPPEAVDKQWQHLRKEVILKLQAFDSRDQPHVIYEGSADALSGCGKIERLTKTAVSERIPEGVVLKESRQQRVNGWREMITEARSQFKESRLSLFAILEQDARFETFRRHLSSAALEGLKHGTGVRSMEEIWRMLDDEITRIEETWGLR